MVRVSPYLFVEREREEIVSFFQKHRLWTKFSVLSGRILIKHSGGDFFPRTDARFGIGLPSPSAAERHPMSAVQASLLGRKGAKI